MADHYLKSIEYVDEAECVRVELDKLYRTPKTERGINGTMLRPQHVQNRINADEAKYRRLLKLAEIHSNLAVRQELQEIATGLQFQGVRP